VLELLASLVFKDNLEYSNWLDRRFSMLRDILQETSAYQQIFQEGEDKGYQDGIKEGVKEGMKEGVKEGEILGLRQLLMDILQKRFPDVVQLAAPQVNVVNDPALLHGTILKMIEIQSMEEVLRLLLELSKNK